MIGPKPIALPLGYTPSKKDFNYTKTVTKSQDYF
jgi:hypothetical protein